jgi:hypothetical protein
MGQAVVTWIVCRLPRMRCSQVSILLSCLGFTLLNFKYSLPVKATVYLCVPLPSTTAWIPRSQGEYANTTERASNDCERTRSQKWCRNPGYSCAKGAMVVVGEIGFLWENNFVLFQSERRIGSIRAFGTGCCWLELLL